MYRLTRSRHTHLATLLFTITLSVTLSGCMLLGLGAAAGAAVGGCALLDDNNDDRVTEAEFSRGVFTSWNTDGNGTLSESEFDAGVNRRSIYRDWSDRFDTWDTNANGTLTEAEFRTGISEDDGTATRIDSRCDDLGL